MDYGKNIRPPWHRLYNITDLETGQIQKAFYVPGTVPVEKARDWYFDYHEPENLAEVLGAKQIAVSLGESLDETAESWRIDAWKIFHDVIEEDQPIQAVFGPGFTFIIVRFFIATRITPKAGIFDVTMPVSVLNGSPAQSGWMYASDGPIRKICDNYTKIIQDKIELLSKRMCNTYRWRGQIMGD